MVTDALGTDVDPAAVFFARVLAAATLGIGMPRCWCATSYRLTADWRQPVA
jgi:hypothetical protein